jgi:class 3 adenylate cyclase/tetratricopeptide (TPR) repeat protein
MIAGYRRALEGERKLVTILFADLTGSLELLAGRDPEEARGVLDPVLQHMMAAVHRYEGTVNQLMGDGIMALFGAPVAHEDHAARACYAALAMQESIRQFATQVESRLGSSIQIRVGLNSGEVVVRAIGNDLHMDYSAIGETTHLASRMEMMAPPGTIRLTLATLRLAEPFVQARPLGLVPVRGRRNPVEVFELIGARPIRRTEAAVLRGLTRFVGRGQELAELSRALENAVAGHGSVIGAVGEAGIGKSRLFLEFTQSPLVGGCMVLEAGTVSYGRTTAYLPVLDLLRRYFGIQEGAAPASAREKITRSLLTLDERLAEVVTPLLALFGAVSDDDPFPTYDPLRRRELTLEALTLFLLRLSQVEPLVLVVEDLQWIDPETQGFLDRLVERLPAARLLLLVNYRTEYRPPWAGKSDYNQICLEPLSRGDAQGFLNALLGDHPDLESLRQLLIERADGNPFFLEENVRALVDDGLLVGEAGRYRPARVFQPHVPATVQAVLAARIDRLPADEKSLLQRASVIGKDFRLALLESIADLPAADIAPALRSLQQVDFLFERVSFPEPAYSFKHALTHEVAYGGLLHDHAKVLHARLVSAIERLYATTLGDHAEALAHHAVLGEVWPKAVDYLRQAGAAAFARGSVEESLHRYEKALTLADRLEPSTDNTGRRIDARLDLHVPLIVLGQVSRLIELHGESERLARELDDSPRLGRLLYRMSQYAWIEGRFKEGLERAQQAFDIASAIGDAEVGTLATYALGLNHCLLGAYRPAIDLFERVVNGPDAERAKRLLAVTVPAYVGAAGWLGYSLTLVGDIDRALLYTDRAAQAADESDHPQAQAIAYTLRVISLLYHGQMELAVALSERAVRLCESNALLVWLPGATATLGWALALVGRAADGIAHLEFGATTMEAIGVRSNLSRLYVWWADALLMAGRLADARRVVDRAIDLAVTYGERGYEADALHTSARLTAVDGRTELRDAVGQYERARELAVQLGMRPLVGRCHLGLGRLYSAAGDKERAKAHIALAVKLFRDMGLHFWLAEAEAS